ncbi:unnamed protein product, partial [Staurois parvus]
TGQRHWVTRHQVHLARQRAPHHLAKAVGSESTGTTVSTGASGTGCLARQRHRVTRHQVIWQGSGHRVIWQGSRGSESLGTTAGNWIRYRIIWDQQRA